MISYMIGKSICSIFPIDRIDLFLVSLFDRLKMFRLLTNHTALIMDKFGDIGEYFVYFDNIILQTEKKPISK